MVRLLRFFHAQRSAQSLQIGVPTVVAQYPAARGHTDVGRRGQFAADMVNKLAGGVAMTVFCIAIASSTLFCTPRPMCNGATITAAWRR